MKIGVVGTGYVGLTTGAGFAECGHSVICADIDEQKVTALKQGSIPFFEPGLEELVRDNMDRQRLAFTTGVAEAVRASEVVFIAVGTPSCQDGSADLAQVLDAAAAIGRAMEGDCVVVTKSTVPVGTVVRVRRTIQAETKHRAYVCSNPEFLREGAAVKDFMNPDRIVIGADDPEAVGVLNDLYQPFSVDGEELLIMDSASAEITKYAANAMLASRISFMNMIASLCEKVGASVDLVRRGLSTDRRIGSSYLLAGVGYGGSCFPKDVKALSRIIREEGLDSAIVDAVQEQNERQKNILLEKAADRFGSQMEGLVFAFWGLAFKPGTDDMREAPSLSTIRGLLARGARVAVRDPVAIPGAKRIFGSAVAYGRDDYEVLEGADALFLHTEWPQYSRPDFVRMRSLLRQPVIFDGRNVYSPEEMRAAGFEYYSVGRAAVLPRDSEDPPEDRPEDKKDGA